MKKAKKIEWKDTRLPFCVEYQYSLFTKNRCIFFYCLAKNARKMLNYAENFTHPSNICLIYVYGAVAEKVQELLSEKRGHIMMLVSENISPEDIQAVSDYDKWITALKKQDYLKILNPGQPKSEFNKRLVGVEYGNEPSDRWYKTYNRPDFPPFYSIYTAGLDLIERYKKAIRHITEAQQDRLKVLSNFSAVDSISGLSEEHDSEILKIIRQLYPYGVEADTTDENAVKLLKIKKLVKAAELGEKTSDVEKLGITFGGDSDQLCLWDSHTVGASEWLSWIKAYCDKAIKESGYFDIAKLWYQLSAPPYGAYECNWYAYIFAVALQEYRSSDYFLGDSHTSHHISENDSFICRSGCVFVQNEQQEEFRLLFAKLFDIEDPHETTQMLMYQVCSWVTSHIKWVPLDCIDHRFHEIFVDNDGSNDWYAHRRYWLKFGYEKEYLPWLKENFDILYSRIRSLDENFRQYLIDHYGPIKTEGYCRVHTVRGGAVGWLHTKDMLKEGIERYMNSMICIECGDVIGHACDTDFGYETSELIDGETHAYYFTKKDIIGLNKKLLGRNRSEYLCIPCLAEFAEASEVELWHMMHDFKEQGCELFT